MSENGQVPGIRDELLNPSPVPYCPTCKSAWPVRRPSREGASDMAARSGRYWKKHQKKEIEELLWVFHEAGWRIEDPPKYL